MLGPCPHIVAPFGRYQLPLQDAGSTYRRPIRPLPAPPAGCWVHISSPHSAVTSSPCRMLGPHIVAPFGRYQLPLQDAGSTYRRPIRPLPAPPAGCWVPVHISSPHSAVTSSPCRMLGPCPHIVAPFGRYQPPLQDAGSLSTSRRPIRPLPAPPAGCWVHISSPHSAVTSSPCRMLGPCPHIVAPFGRYQPPLQDAGSLSTSRRPIRPLPAPPAGCWVHISSPHSAVTSPPCRMLGPHIVAPFGHYQPPLQDAGSTYRRPIRPLPAPPAGCWVHISSPHSAVTSPPAGCWVHISSPHSAVTSAPCRMLGPCPLIVAPFGRYQRPLQDAGSTYRRPIRPLPAPPAGCWVPVHISSPHSAVTSPPCRMLGPCPHIVAPFGRYQPPLQDAGSLSTYRRPIRPLPAPPAGCWVPVHISSPHSAVTSPPAGCWVHISSPHSAVTSPPCRMLGPCPHIVAPFGRYQLPLQDAGSTYRRPIRPLPAPPAGCWVPVHISSPHSAVTSPPCRMLGPHIVAPFGRYQLPLQDAGSTYRRPIRPLPAPPAGCWVHISSPHSAVTSPPCRMLGPHIVAPFGRYQLPLQDAGSLSTYRRPIRPLPAPPAGCWVPVHISSPHSAVTSSPCRMLGPCPHIVAPFGRYQPPLQDAGSLSTYRRPIRPLPAPPAGCWVPVHISSPHSAVTSPPAGCWVHISSPHSAVTSSPCRMLGPHIVAPFGRYQRPLQDAGSTYRRPIRPLPAPLQDAGSLSTYRRPIRPLPAPLQDAGSTYRRPIRPLPAPPAGCWVPVHISSPHSAVTSPPAGCWVHISSPHSAVTSSPCRMLGPHIVAPFGRYQLPLQDAGSTYRRPIRPLPAPPAGCWVHISSPHSAVTSPPCRMLGPCPHIVAPFGRYQPPCRMLGPRIVAPFGRYQLPLQVPLT